MGAESCVLQFEPEKQVGAEAEAKAALAQFLKKSGALTQGSAIALELVIAKQTNRADMAVITKNLEIFEIKTSRDNLNRLDSQILSYETAAHFVNVVAATKHVNTVLSRVPAHVGILEIIKIGGTTAIRPVRAATESPKWQASAALELLPASEIRARLLGGIGPKSRAEILLQTAALPPERQREAVVKFLRERYRASTHAFLRLVRRRTVRPEDLNVLHIWSELNKTVPKNQHAKNTFNEEYLRFVGKSFGPVPDEVISLLNA